MDLYQNTENHRYRQIDLRPNVKDQTSPNQAINSWWKNYELQIPIRDGHFLLSPRGRCVETKKPSKTNIAYIVYVGP